MIKKYCVALCIVSWAFGAQAQSQDVLLEGQDVFEWMQAEYEEDYVVSASKRKQKLSEVPAQVSVIAREQIERSGSTSLGEILRQIPNLHVMRVSNGGYKVVPRGFSDEYLLLVDGIERNSISNLTPDPMAFFAVTDIERIEFVHGPGSTMYGANAYSGILNIITRRAEEPGHTVWADMAGGEWNQKYLSSGVRGKEGEWDYTTVVAANMLESQSPYERVDAEFYSVRGALGYAFDEEHALRLSAAVQQGLYPEQRPTGYDSVVRDAQMQELVLNYLQGQWAFRSYIRQELREIVVGGLTTSSFGEPTNVEPPGIIATRETFVNRDLISDSELTYATEVFDDSFVNLGANYRFKSYNRTLAADNSVELPYLGGEDEWRLGIFSTFDTEFDERWLLSIGLRGDLNSSKQNFLNPRLSVIHKLNDSDTLRLTLLQAFRKPTAQEFGERFKYRLSAGPTNELFDMYLDGGLFPSEEGTTAETLLTSVEANLANPDLISQKVYTVELAYRMSLLDSELQLGLDGYYELHRDTIGFVERGTISFAQRQDECIEAVLISTSVENSCNYLQIGNSDTPFDSIGVIFSFDWKPLR